MTQLYPTFAYTSGPGGVGTSLTDVPIPDPSIATEVLPTGGVVGLTLYSRAQTGTWTLTRSIVGSSIPAVTVYSGPPLAPVLAPWLQIPWVDAGDNTPLPLDPAKQYTWTLTTTNGTFTTPAVSPVCSITINPDQIVELVIKMLKAGVESLRVPAGYTNKPAVIHAMPLAGQPALPIISINEDLLQQAHLGTGDSTNSDTQLNNNLSSAIVQRRISVTVMTTTVDERKFYRDAVIGIFRTMAGPALGRLGSDITHTFQAADSQNIERDSSPGFYFSVIMLEIKGQFSIGVSTNYAVVSAIIPDIVS